MEAHPTTTTPSPQRCIIGYIVDHRSEHDDQITLQLFTLFPVATTRTQAWKNFIKLVGKDRQHWNKLGYITIPVKLTIELPNGSTP